MRLASCSSFGVDIYWRTRGQNVAYNLLLDIALPLGAIAICGYTLWKTLHPTPAYHHPVTWAPWLGLGWLALGIAVTAWLHARSPERVETFGSILGASE